MGVDQRAFFDSLLEDGLRRAVYPARCSEVRCGEGQCSYWIVPPMGDRLVDRFLAWLAQQSVHKSFPALRDCVTWRDVGRKVFEAGISGDDGKRTS